MADWSERLLIEQIRQRCPQGQKGLIQSIGDDCCQVAVHDGALLVTTDTLVDGVHFDRSFHPPQLLGRKSVAVNLSDIAAMGGKPGFVQLSLCLPEEIEQSWLDSYLEGVFDILAEYETPLTGGDTVKGDQLVITVTAFGTPGDKGAVYRNGARAGDGVWVSGELGSAGCGLQLFLREKKEPGIIAISAYQSLLNRHLDPAPRIHLGLELGRTGMVSAMQDISDGLATDLAHICKASGVSAHIDTACLPYLPELTAAASALGIEVEDLILRSGEDYELVFTVRKGEERAFSQMMEKSGEKVTRIGEIRAGQGVFLEKETGIEEISFQGYEH
ncbi:MAG: thiamine-phosphate kinase [Thermodesulfobacteriota bacterium]